jgi:hypothetical protein
MLLPVNEDWLHILRLPVQHTVRPVSTCVERSSFVESTSVEKGFAHQLTTIECGLLFINHIANSVVFCVFFFLFSFLLSSFSLVFIQSFPVVVRFSKTWQLSLIESYVTKTTSNKQKASTCLLILVQCYFVLVIQTVVQLKWPLTTGLPQTKRIIVRNRPLKSSFLFRFILINVLNFFVGNQLSNSWFMKTVLVDNRTCFERVWQHFVGLLSRTTASLKIGSVGNCVWFKCFVHTCKSSMLTVNKNWS